MARIGFYHLIRQNLDQALPKLLDKAIQSGARVVVLAGSSERITELDERLWVYEDESWLPHGRAGDANADLQPIWLTDAEENPNNANILVLGGRVIDATAARAMVTAWLETAFAGGRHQARLDKITALEGELKIQAL